MSPGVFPNAPIQWGEVATPGIGGPFVPPPTNRNRAKKHLSFHGFAGVIAFAKVDEEDAEAIVEGRISSKWTADF